ncbi:peptidoglycan DD-metalloendopeptidase family protein [Anaeromyxobacter diazotrophicus]|uniref:peptidoglycan DD-metalloendopeptidase family protein n=1 Tax=Anaeromyxobacter diazotrophicus TaxID=2590199 RepID=UPI001F27EAE0|nr:peptidoglycan DD-metalloendopeptidase family protein [Anaeromyxobacter diazotrophicus]
MKPPGADAARLHQAAQQLEGLFLKQLVTSSKAFTGGEGAGSAVRADLFADALAGALVKSGGIGLARQVERSLGADPTATPTPTPTATAMATSTASSIATAAAGAPEGGAPSPADLLPAHAVTSPFGLRQDPFDGRLTRHEGVDLAAGDGEPIRAAAGGVVVRAGARGGYGDAVEIDHGDGLTTLYAHASQLLVREGDTVTPGQAIARVGHTGRATGSHLHFEVRQGGRAVDPARALKNYRLRADDLLGSRS